MSTIEVPSIKGKKLNKGEWAEFYVLLTLLGEGRVYSADKMLKKNLQSYLDIIKVIRQEYATQILEYIVNEQEGLIYIQAGKEILDTIPMKDFKENADILYAGIKDLKGNSVAAPDVVCEFASIIYVSKPKAPSVKALEKMFGGKNDIFIEVRDGQTSIVSLMGFSIKSKFAEPPTLFNAGTSSQFIYEVQGCTRELMDEFNSLRDGKNRGWAKCREYLLDHNLTLKYTSTQYPVYGDNLFLIRESMDKIMAWCFEDRLIHASKDFEVMETVERMIVENPVNAPKPEVYYEKAIKDFLMAGFTGMTAGRVWDGKEQVTGGYIAVMGDGEVLCYHSNDRESFRDYLYRNTFFEYVGSKKYKWSYIFEEEGKFYLPLNASIRFRRQDVR